MFQVPRLESNLFKWLSRRDSDSLQGPYYLDSLDVTRCSRRVPEAAGIYFFVSKRFAFKYPQRKSKIYYIGRAKNLRKRLQTHKRYATQKRRLNRYWGRYEYARAFGCVVYWLQVSSRSVKRKEKECIKRFGKFFLAPPVTNSQSYW